MTDIDQGKGKTGEVTKDGFDHVNDFAGKDVFVMGKDGNDFFLNGKEVVGSENGGDSFKFGDKKPDIGNGGQMNDMAQQFMQLLNQLLQMLGLGGQGDEFALQGGQGGGQGMFDGNGGDNLFAMGNQNGGANGANQNGFAEGEPNPNAPNQQQGRGLQNGLGALIQLFQALSRIASLLEQLNQGRQPQGQLM